MSDDRRMYERIPDRNSVAVTILAAPANPELEDQTFFCLTKNVSSGGLMFSTGSRLPPGSLLEVRVAFIEPVRSFQLEGRVAWSGSGENARGCPMGLELTGGKGRDLEAWHQVIAQKTRSSGITEDGPVSTA